MRDSVGLTLRNRIFDQKIDVVFASRRTVANLGLALFLLGFSLLSACAHAPPRKGASMEKSEPGTASTEADGSPAEHTKEPGREDEAMPDESAVAMAPAAKSRCTELGLSFQAFNESAGAYAFEQIVPKMELPTVEGRWSLGDQWSGCDNYLFAVIPNSQKGRELAESSFAELMTEGEGNTHYFFIPSGRGAKQALLSEAPPEKLGSHPIEQLKKSYEKSFDALPADQKVNWEHRIHFVTESADSMPWLSGLLDRDSRLVAFGIDRRQRLREGRNLKYLEVAEDKKSYWWTDRISHLRFLSTAFNYEIKFADHLASESLLGRQDLLNKQDIPSKTVFEVPFPNLATLESATNIDLNLKADCPGDVHPHIQHCGEWDTTGFLYFCAEGSSEKECKDPTEVYRWITPYASPGHWTSDTAPLLTLLREYRSAYKNEHKAEPKSFWFKVKALYTYKYSMSLRFKQGNKLGELRPFAQKLVYPTKDYPFTPDYDSKFPAFRFTVPEGTKRVQIVARTTGHGMTDPEGCAEFCTHEHKVSVNGKDFKVEYPMAEEDSYTCARRSNEGVTPNQFGTWFFARAAWCPGFKVDPWVVDVTESINLGGKNVIRYSGTHKGEKPPGKGAVIHTGLRLIFWK